MARQGQHVNLIRLHIYRNMAHSLYGIRVEEHFLFPAQRADLTNRLKGADFIIGIHNGHQRCIFPQRSGHIRHFNNPFFPNRQQRDLKALLLQPFQRMRCV